MQLLMEPKQTAKDGGRQKVEHGIMEVKPLFLFQ